MQQPSDVACNLTSAVTRGIGRSAEFLIEAQIEFSRLQLKIAEAALEDVREIEHAVGDPHDWASLVLSPNMLMKMQSTHGATALKSWIDFANNLLAAYLRQLTEWNGQMQLPQGQTSSSPLFAASADSLRAFFGSFNVVAGGNSDKETNPSQPVEKAACAPAA
ncbi:hypothetical protein [Ralstonia pseudosolanacearum]|uniref:Phasin domain-containing protein n=1 Tax=Ralstonia solanacearum TaxID=305 RepID=A0AA92JQQ0_RALSL|nr:hypothetical protein [Ralstonia pseudosolanacearum]QOK91075.1 hypothetical protein HF908_06000 [Ralstonia pseudosolanacearum]QOK97374.1 hypothetical protein HF909_13655 [Ralstonia pseudosolanacearum]UWD92109.1 hypothetical protein NY025_14130 [Ralstonia pseudosolanacearum]CAH0444101.1 hypothetical protein LMG9673_04287 [Ralstonia pseudosolanacearum]